MRVKITPAGAAMYAVYALVILFLNYTVKGIPLSIAPMFAMLVCGTNIVTVPAVYIAVSAVNADWIYSLCALFEGAFLAAVTFVYRRAGKKIRAEAAAYVCIALCPFVAFADWRAGILSFLGNAYTQRAFAAVSITIFSCLCMRAVHSLIFRLCRCRLRPDEVICLALLYVSAGTGLYNLAGKTVYICICAGLIAFSVRLARSPSAALFSLLCGIPCALVTADIHAVTYFVLLGTVALPFARLGRGTPSAVCLCAVAIYFYFDGVFSSVAVGVLWGFLLFCCSVAAAIPADKKLDNLRDLLSVIKRLPAAEERRVTDALADELFRISEVFREIDCAFRSLDDDIDESALKVRAYAELKERMCSSCPRRGDCVKTKVYRGFTSLIDAGALKGKVSLVDLTADVTQNCINPSDLLECANKILAEYRRLITEAENAKSGRKLLSEQASGVAAVLKDRAAAMYRTGNDCALLEKAVKNELSANGISCSEINCCVLTATNVLPV